MRLLDTYNYSRIALKAYPARTSLILLAMSIGVASVIILTSLGEGARQYVIGQFNSLGTNLLFVMPGKTETKGGIAPLVGTSTRDLTIEDALSLKQVANIQSLAPLSLGAAPVSYGSKEREVTVIGSSSELVKVLDLKMRQGKFIPNEDPRRGLAVCVLGERLYKELFNQQRVLGSWVRIGKYRYRVIGILGSKAQSIGLDMSNTVLIPVANAQSMFNAPSLFRIMLKLNNPEAASRVEEDVIRIIKKRHDDTEDITVVSQDALVGTFDDILKILTLALAGIAAISLFVAGILIMNVMMISVSQRKAEIGLLKALGAPTRQVLLLFLSEALMLSLIGGFLGLLIGLGGAQMIDYLLPDFSIQTPLWSIFAALGVTVFVGLFFGGVPAHQATKLDPVLALSGK